MNHSLSFLSQKSLVTIFAYAPAGLGHLRVTEALYHGLPSDVTPILLRSQDSSVTTLHYLTSISPWGQKLQEFFQQGLPEEIFTKFYRTFLRSKTKTLYQQISTLLDERVELPRTVLVVATHFGLAHQLAAIKTKISADKYVKIILIVQVTDDTTQHIWYVPGADLTLVPSEQTRQGLSAYAKKQGEKDFHCEVLPYPISPLLAESLSPEKYQQKIEQLDPQQDKTIHLSVPISGAGVGTDYASKLLDLLRHTSNCFFFHIVSRSASHTQKFLAEMLHRDCVELNVSPSTREIVDKYERLYQKKPISLEMTKPSEQAFKVLLSPRQVGGSILLLCHPVGLQEQDNLAFLRRHNFIPSLSQKKSLWEKSWQQISLPDEERKNFRCWRGLEIPDDPQKAAVLIHYCLREGLFFIMMKDYLPPQDLQVSRELGSDGVKRFWQTVSAYVQEAG